MNVPFFTTDSKSTVAKGRLFLTSALTFHFFVRSLPSSVSALGLFGSVEGEASISMLSSAVGMGAAFLCCYLLLDLVLRLEGWTVLLDGWPPGALGVIPWLRISCMLFIGFCLSSTSQLWPALAFLVFLLQFHRDAVKKRLLNLQRLGELLWDLRLCWAALITSCFLFQPVQAASANSLALSSAVVVLSLGLQLHPRLSFAFAFFHAKAAPQAILERMVWLSRLERLFIALACLGISSNPALLVLLAPFCASRLLLQLSLQSIYKNPAWRETLCSETGPWLTQPHTGQQALVPDLASCKLLAQDPAPIPQPVDRIGDGPLTTTSEPERFAGLFQATVPPEALAAFLVLLLTVVTALPKGLLPPDQQSVLTYQTRAVQVEGRLALFQTETTVGLARLTETLPYERVMVDTGLELPLLQIACLLLVLTASFLRWRNTLLGMWGLPSSEPRHRGRVLCLSALLTLTLCSALGWFWFPPTLALLSFLVVWSQRWPNTTACPPQPRILSALPEPRVYVSPPQEDLVRIEVGRELLFLVDPRLGQPILADGRVARSFREKAGFVLPVVRLRDDLKLRSCEYRVVIRETPVFTGTFDLGTSGEMTPTVVLKLRRRLEEQILPKLLKHAELLFTYHHTQRVLNAATMDHEQLVNKVRERHAPATIRQVMRTLLRLGYSLSRPAPWLEILATTDGTPEQIIEQVVERGKLPMR